MAGTTTNAITNWAQRDADARTDGLTWCGEACGEHTLSDRAHCSVCGDTQDVCQRCDCCRSCGQPING